MGYGLDQLFRDGGSTVSSLTLGKRKKRWSDRECCQLPARELPTATKATARAACVHLGDMELGRTQNPTYVRACIDRSVFFQACQPPSYRLPHPWIAMRLAMTIRRNLSSTVPLASTCSSSSTTTTAGAAHQAKRAVVPTVSYLTSTSTTRTYSQSNKQHHPEPAAFSTTALSSTRGRAAVSLLPSYLADARAVEQYCPTSNPSGALQLGVAESQLIEDWLVPALNTVPELSADAIYYQPTPGRADFKASFASYIEDLCGLPSGRLDHDGLIVGAGCNAVLENLCFALADAGDAVLIPTPYYAAFEFDLVARAALSVEAVTTEAYHPEADYDDSTAALDPVMYYPNRAALDAAYERASLKGNAPKILLLSHPMNPLGICYPAEVVQECIAWCRERQVHLISDEIYAGSVYGGDDAKFDSALKLADNEGSLGPYVHWVYALSKDFCLSGLRVGAAYSENPEIRMPLQKLNDLCQISSQTQLWTAFTMERRLQDETSSSSSSEKWVTAFRRENHKRLKARCTAVSAVLDQYQIPYLRPTAGLFLWMDLSQFLPVGGTPSQRERALYLELVNEFGLLLTPGDSMRNERPGFFRCVFTAASEDEFAIALERLQTFCKSKRAAAAP